MNAGAEQADAEEQADDAAIRIQAIQRGKCARRERSEQSAAATRMQAVQRGKAARKGQKTSAGGEEAKSAGGEEGAARSSSSAEPAPVLTNDGPPAVLARRLPRHSLAYPAS